MLDGLLGILTSAGTGGIVGILGSAVGKLFGFFQHREEAKERHLQREHEARMLQLSFQNQHDAASRQLQIEERKAYAQQLEASYKHDAQGETSKWVNNVLRFYRPALTTFLMIMVFWFFESLETTDYELKEYIITYTVFVAVMAVSWWFADRARPPKALTNLVGSEKKN